MSKELQEKADRMMKDLRDALQPIAAEIKKLKNDNLPDECNIK